MGYLGDFEVALSRFRAALAGERGSLEAVTAKVEHFRGMARDLEGKVQYNKVLPAGSSTSLLLIRIQVAALCRHAA